MDDEELERLRAAAARINRVRMARDCGEAAGGETPRSPAEYWREVFDQAIREVARKNAQLAAAGLVGGSIHIAQRKVNGSKAIGRFGLAFLDGLVLRRPELVVSVYKDRRVTYEWVAGDCLPGELDPTKDLRAQMSELVMQLCEIIA